MHSLQRKTCETNQTAQSARATNALAVVLSRLWSAAYSLLLRYDRFQKARSAILITVRGEMFAARWAATCDTSHFASKLGWTGHAFNGPGVNRLAGLRNGKVILYGNICKQLQVLVRDLFAFTGLDWNQQTAEFLPSSTKARRQSAHCGEFRDTAEAPARWREMLSNADQDSIRSGLQHSPLARF